MSSTIVNGSTGASSTDSNPSSAPMSNTAKQSTKSATTSNKNSDGSRKQTGNPGISVEGSQSRRNPPPKAWTGVNPITQRSNTPNQQNGVEPKAGSLKPMANQISNTTNELGSERLTYLLGNFMGHTASITVKSGDTFSGIFFGANSDGSETTSYLLKMAQQIRSVGKAELSTAQEPTNDFVGVDADHSMSFDMKDVLHMAVEGVTLGGVERRTNGAAAGFRTDTDISGNLAFRERTLQPWISPAENDVDLSIDSSAEPWDQFRANELKFGLKTDYDENIYTTRIDRSTPQYRQQAAAAKRLAREIERNPTGIAHSREERGLADENGELDEEEKYSGVLRQGGDYPPLQSSQPNRYMPPARRPPGGKPTVTGAAVDPAIISSQIARPETSAQKPVELASSDAEDASKATAPKENMSSEVKKDYASNGSASKTTAINNVRSAESSKPPAPNATANVETEMVNSFRTFVEVKKQQVTDDRRQRINKDKAVKLNDLKGFSKNFKLHTPVPKDLVPILAKDKKKQEEIVEKAQRNINQQSSTPPKAPASSADQLPSRPITESKHDGTRAPPNNVDRQDHTSSRSGVPPRGPQGGPSRDRMHQPLHAFPINSQNGSGLLSHRLADNQRQHKAGLPVTVPTPLPIHVAQKSTNRAIANPTPVTTHSQSSSTARTPTSAKFNVKANEFKPNPSANTFKPIGMASDASSPRSNPNAGSTPRAPSPSDFFKARKPRPSEDQSSDQGKFDSLKYLKAKAEKEEKDYAANSGIAHAHSTPVRWTNVTGDEDIKSYKDMIEDVPAVSSGVSPRQTAISPINPNLSLLHQLPPHLQNSSQHIPHMQTSPQPPYQGPPHPHHYSGIHHPYEEHRMHPSPPASSAYSTPRVPNNYVSYPSPMSQPAPFHYGQPFHPQFLGPGGPQPPGYRPYPNPPQYMPSPGPQLAAPVMVPQNSQGGYIHGMPVPHMQMFPPGPAQPYNGPSQPPSAYPSPSRTAPMMMHSGSYSGQAPQMHPNGAQYGQPLYAQHQPPHMAPMRSYPPPHPQYSQSPQQQYHYPLQPTRMPSHGYGQAPSGPQHHMAAQHPPPPVAPMEGGEGMK